MRYIVELDGGPSQTPYDPESLEGLRARLEKASGRYADPARISPLGAALIDLTRDPTATQAPWTHADPSTDREAAAWLAKRLLPVIEARPTKSLKTRAARSSRTAWSISVYRRPEPPEHTSEVWDASIVAPGDPENWHRAPTPALAICLALVHVLLARALRRPA